MTSLLKMASQSNEKLLDRRSCTIFESSEDRFRCRLPIERERLFRPAAVTGRSSGPDDRQFTLHSCH